MVVPTTRKAPAVGMPLFSVDSKYNRAVRQQLAVVRRLERGHASGRRRILLHHQREDVLRPAA